MTQTKYRLVKKYVWWTRVFDTTQPQFLYWDKDLETFEVGGYGTIHRWGHLYEFSKHELEMLKMDYPDLEEHFLIEETGRKKYDK